MQVQVHPSLEVVEEVLAMGFHAHERPPGQSPGVLGEAPLRGVGGELATHQPAVVDAREAVDDVSFGHSGEVTPGR